MLVLPLPGGCSLTRRHLVPNLPRALRGSRREADHDDAMEPGPASSGSASIRPAKPRDREAIAELVGVPGTEQEAAPRRTRLRGERLLREIALVGLWTRLTNSLTAMLPLHLLGGDSPAYVFAEDDRVRGFVQAQTSPRDLKQWQIVGLAAREREHAGQLERDEVEERLLEHLVGEGTERGIIKYFARLEQADPSRLALHRARFHPYALEVVLVNDNPGHPGPLELPGLRRARDADAWKLYQLYLAISPPAVTQVEGPTREEWQRSPFVHLSPALAKEIYLIEQDGEVSGVLGLHPAVADQPHRLQVAVHPSALDLAVPLLRQGLSLLAARRQRPVWCAARSYQGELITAARRLGFRELLSQVVMVRQSRVEVRRLEPALVPAFG